jgi:hypothetical protein
MLVTIPPGQSSLFPLALLSCSGDAAVIVQRLMQPLQQATLKTADGVTLPITDHAVSFIKKG